MKEEAPPKRIWRNARSFWDALDNISWNSDICTLNDVDQTYADVEEVCTLLQNTRKPFWYFASSMENLEAQYEMFKAVAGGAETLRIRPFTINLVCPLDALRHSDHGVSQLIYCAERGLPVVYIPGTEFGLTSPATMAGTLAAGIADLLPAVVISQLVNKGAPIIAACFRNNVDFRTMKLNHSRPEMITANCATAEVWRYMGLPFCCNMANTATEISVLCQPLKRPSSITVLCFPASICVTAWAAMRKECCCVPAT